MRLVVLLGVGSVALAAGYTAQELVTLRKERLLNGFHQPAIVLTGSLYGAYVGVRPPGGTSPRAERTPHSEALFVGQMHIAYRRILTLGDELLALYASHRGPPFETGAARLRRSLRQVRELHETLEGDEREFAEALAASDLSLPLIAQQLERFHQAAARQLAGDIARAREVTRIVYAVVAVGLLATMGAFARRSLRAIQALLEAERGAKEALLIKDQAMATSITPLAITDAAERVVYVNPAFLRLWGFASEDLALGRKLGDLTSGDAIRQAVTCIRRSGSWQGEVSVARADGSRMELLVSASAVTDSVGEPVYVMVSALDLTERRKLEDQLLQAQKMESIGRLAGGVAHDFNNLLTGINGSVEFGLEQLPQGSPAREALHEVKRAADSAANLVRQLLAFSRRQIIRPRVVDLNEVIAGLGKMLPRLLGEEIALQIRPEPGLGQVRLDPGQAEQILLNLAVNARDAMPDGGRLELETANVTVDEEHCAVYPQARPGRYVTVAVSDSGVGMAPEVKAHIFEPFFTTKPKGLGTGLGLATVYGAVKQNGGMVEVYSEPGKGTTFKIYLPRVYAQIDVTAHQELRSVRGSEAVFLVEDDDRVRVVAERALSLRGYSVRAFAQGPQALAALPTLPERPALLLTDVVLGEMNGGELADRMKALVPGLKVLFTSGYTENVIVRHGVLKEGINFIAKPYAPEDLARRVREVLDGAA